MDVLTAILASGGAGAALGYLLKAMLDHKLRQASTTHAASVDVAKVVTLRELEQNEYLERYFYSPLAQCLDRLVARVRIALDGRWGLLGYDEIYVESTFLYEASALTFWLEQANVNPRIRQHLDRDDERHIRTALSTLTGFREYDQREIASHMCDPSADGLPISYAAFRSRSWQMPQPGWEPTGSHDHLPIYGLLRTLPALDKRRLEIADALDHLEQYAIHYAMHPQLINAYDRAQLERSATTISHEPTA